MNEFHHSTTLSIYYNIQEIIQWRDLMLQAFNREISLEDPNNETTMGELEKSLQFYYIESLNFPDKQEELIEELTNTLSKKLSIPISQLVKIMNEAKERVNVPRYTAYPNISTYYTEGDNLTKVTIGTIEFELPKSTYDHLVKRANTEEVMTRLLLRYYPLGPTSGYFWSMDRRLYSYVASKTELPLIEGFASPFNYNLPNYCAGYPEDMLFGAKGDFFTYIKHVNVKTMMVVNPPYTNQVMDETSRACIKQVERVPGTEIILMLPYWSDHESIMALLNTPNCQSIIFDKYEYVIHDYGTDKVIKPQMGLYFFILHSPDYQPIITPYDLRLKMSELVRES